MYQSYCDRLHDKSSSMDIIQETLVIVPAELVRRSVCISIDMGGSLLKAIYRSRENAEEMEANPDSKTGHLTFISAYRKHVREAVDHLSVRAEINRDLGDGVIHTTGLGCTVHAKLMAEKLNIKLENVTEFDCFAKSLLYLTRRLSRADLFEPFDLAAAEKPLAILQQSLAVLKATQAQGKTSMEAVNEDGLDLGAIGRVDNDSPRPVAEVEKDLFPCVLAMFGSGLGFLRINSNGTFNLIDGSISGGLSLLGLGSLLTGCQTYEELIELARNGNPMNVDIYSSELLNMYKENGEGADNVAGDGSIYSMAAAAQGTPIYGFGKCVSAKPDDFKREDLARALLDKYVTDMVHITMLVAHSSELNRLYFTGGFLNTPFIRGLVTAECAKRNMYRAMARKAPVKFDFLKTGPCMGAVGALVSHYEKYVASADSTNF